MIQARSLDFSSFPDKITKIATVGFPQDVQMISFPFTAIDDCYVRLGDTGTISQNGKQIRNSDNSGYSWHLVAKGDTLTKIGEGSVTGYLFPIRYV